MGRMTPEQIQEMIDQLGPEEQARLLESLALRVGRHRISRSPADTGGKGGDVDPWSHFFRLGDAIAALDTPHSETLTGAVTRTRR